MRDQTVSKRRQTLLYDALPDAEVYRIDGDHDAVVEEADQFSPTLVRAISSVHART